MRVLLGFLTLILLFTVGLVIATRWSLTARTQLPYDSTVPFAGKKLSYKKLGSGDPIILVHGSLYARPWGTFNSDLAKTHTVYTVDLPGFGASDTIIGRVHNTDLFAEGLCAFIKDQKLENAPVVSFSLGTVTAAKAAAQQCSRGTQIFVGMPGKVSGWQIDLSERVPLFLKRIIAATDIGKRKLLVPTLYQNIGNPSQTVTATLVKNLRTTSPQSLIDTDYRKEIETDLPLALKKVTTKTYFIYGEQDALKGTTTNLINDFIAIPNAGHNVFGAQPKVTLKILETLLEGN